MQEVAVSSYDHKGEHVSATEGLRARKKEKQKRSNFSSVTPNKTCSTRQHQLKMAFKDKDKTLNSEINPFMHLSPVRAPLLYKLFIVEFT